jgi:hypothetical protein
MSDGEKGKQRKGGTGEKIGDSEMRRWQAAGIAAGSQKPELKDWQKEGKMEIE